MIIEICLPIIAIVLGILLVILMKMASQVQQNMQSLQTDVHQVSTDLSELIRNLNEWVRSDLPKISGETTQWISQLNHATASISEKAHSLHFVFKLLKFLRTKFGSDSLSDDSGSKCETIPQTMKWIASTLILIKTTKEFIKHHEKRTN